jgi:hypothetical protein
LSSKIVQEIRFLQGWVGMTRIIEFFSQLYHFDPANSFKGRQWGYFWVFGASISGFFQFTKKIKKREISA